MRVSELFTLHQGNSFELINMEVDRRSEINFVARTSENNGVTAKIKLVDTISPFPAGYITVALGGSVLSSFVQYKPFYTGFHVMVLEPKKEMRLEEKLFYCHSIKMNAYRYRYGRQANKTLKDIELPELSDWIKTYTIDYSTIETKIEKKELPFDTSQWKKFKIGDIFDFKRGKGITKEEIENNAGDIPCVQSGEMNRGIIGYMNSKFIDDKFHTYILAPFLNLARSGTSGCVNIQNKNSYVGDSAIALKLKQKETVFVYLFLETILNLERYRYTYGRKVVIEKYIEQFISLPANIEGNPDWYFMENYIKALPYSDKI
jgi:restriction endonuclease S subunit